MAKALLIDVTRCVGCGMCYEACKETHDLPIPDEPETELSANALTVLQERGDYYVRKLCMHCEEPSCVSACPVAALTKSPDGPVVYDESRCIGCRYCLLACPFDVPRYEWSKVQPYVRKCTMCYEEHVKQGEPTACADACQFEATMFGERDDMLRMAHERIADDPDTYASRIYGEREVGGTSTLMLTPQDVDYESLGLKRIATQEPMPKFTWEVLSKIPSLVVTLGTLLTGIWWITSRREDVRRAEKGETHEHLTGEVDHDRQ